MASINLLKRDLENLPNKFLRASNIIILGAHKLFGIINVSSCYSIGFILSFLKVHPRFDLEN